MLMTLILIMVQGITSGVNAQEGAQVDPEIQRKAQTDLQAITNYLASPSPRMTMRTMGVSSEKNIAEKIADADMPQPPAWLDEDLLKTEQGRQHVMMEILLMKNQIFQDGDMPSVRKLMNVESLLNDLRFVMTDEEFRRLASNETLLKQLGLFAEETLEDQ